MWKKFLMFLTLLYAVVAFAAVDVNTANEAELDSVKGIGPAISKRVMDERKKGNFKDWNDLKARVNGFGDKTSAKFSEAGLTVNGAPFGDKKASNSAATPAAPASAASKPVATASKAEDKKPAAKADDKKASAPVAPASKAEDKKAAKADKTASADDALVKSKGCLACHAVDKKVVGPSYKDVAKKYAGDKKAADMLATKIIKGGSGTWGPTPMPPNNVTEAEAKKLTAWVLSQK